MTNLENHLDYYDKEIGGIIPLGRPNYGVKYLSKQFKDSIKFIISGHQDRFTLNLFYNNIICPNPKYINKIMNLTTLLYNYKQTIESKLSSNYTYNHYSGNEYFITLKDLTTVEYTENEFKSREIITINDKTKLIGLTLSSATISKLLYYSCYGIIEYNTGIDKETINLYWKNACSGANFAKKEPNKSNIIKINEKVC